MKIEKKFTVNASQQEVWEFITVPEKVAPCVPGCEGAEDLGGGKYKASVKVGIGPINTKFDLDVETLEQRAPEYAVYSAKGDEGGKASRIKSETTLSLTPNGNYTDVHYVSEVSIVGRLGKFGSGLVNKVADSIGEQFVANIKKSIEGDAPVTNETPDGFGMGLTDSVHPSSSKNYIIAGILLVIVSVFVLYVYK